MSRNILVLDWWWCVPNAKHMQGRIAATITETNVITWCAQECFAAYLAPPQSPRVLPGYQPETMTSSRSSLAKETFWNVLLVVFSTRSKKLLGAPGIATRSKDATRGSWPYYYSQVQLSETT